MQNNLMQKYLIYITPLLSRVWIFFLKCSYIEARTEQKTRIERVLNQVCSSIQVFDSVWFQDAEAAQPPSLFLLLLYYYHA